MPIDMDKLLEAVSFNESSNGKNTKHEASDYGVQKGSKAVGQYGLMPNTIREMLNRNPNPAYDYLRNATDEELQAAIKTPTALQSSPKGLERDTAENLARLLINKHGDNLDNILAGWNAGHNASGDKLEQLKSEAVKRYIEKGKSKYNEPVPDEFLKNLIKRSDYQPNEADKDLENRRQLATKLKEQASTAMPMIEGLANVGGVKALAPAAETATNRILKLINDDATAEVPQLSKELQQEADINSLKHEYGHSTEEALESQRNAAEFERNKLLRDQEAEAIRNRPLPENNPYNEDMNVIHKEIPIEPEDPMIQDILNGYKRK